MIALIGHSRRAAVAGGGAASSVLGNVGGLNSRAISTRPGEENRSVLTAYMVILGE